MNNVFENVHIYTHTPNTSTHNVVGFRHSQELRPQFPTSTLSQVKKGHHLVLVRNLRIRFYFNVCTFAEIQTYRIVFRSIAHCGPVAALKMAGTELFGRATPSVGTPSSDWSKRRFTGDTRSAGQARSKQRVGARADRPRSKLLAAAASKSGPPLV